MRPLARIGAVTGIALVFCISGVAAEGDLRASLRPQNITSVRINLNAWGPHLGFETQVKGDDTRVEALAVLIRDAESAQGHKCANSGAIRFRMVDGRVVGVGLLPSHADGFYDFRLYDGDDFVAVYRIKREALLATLEPLGVPTDDPAFRE